MRRHTALRTVTGKTTGQDETMGRTTGTGSQESRSLTTSTQPTFSILSPLREMERALEENFYRPFFGMGMLPFRHMFQDFGLMGEVAANVDMFEEGGNLVVKAELPGMTRDDISVKIVDNNLVISGEKKSEERVERKDFLRVERSHGTFNRTLSLPEGLDADHVKASYRDGVLEVRIPRVEGRNTVHRIPVD